MKTTILAAFAALFLGMGVAAADPVGHAAPQGSGNHYDWTAGAAGWG